MPSKQSFQESMKIIGCKFLLTAFCMVIVSAFLPSIALAFTDPKEGDDVREIGKEELLEKLKAIHGKDEFVEGYVIDGRDIIRIIDETDVDIKIKDSTIKEGLNFSKLPPLVIGDLKLPEDWNIEEREEWRKKQIEGNPFSHFYQVNNHIYIVNSDVHSFLAKKTLFSELHFISSTFRGDTDFNSTSFGGGASFWYTSFKGDANFDSAFFGGDAYFESVDFKIKGDANFGSATFLGDANFSNAKFRGKANFRTASFSGDANFGSLTTFSGDADFSFASFLSDASFAGLVTFGGKAAFRKTSFRGDANFHRASFSVDADFTRATFSGYANFLSAPFSGKANFQGASFLGDTFFSSVSFRGDAKFGHTTFSGGAYFNSASFIGKADFRSASFNKVVSFNDVDFASRLTFAGTDFKEYVDLRDARISKLDWNSFEKPTTVKARIDFRNVEISEAHLQDIVFERNVYFSNMKFGRPLYEKKDGKEALPSNTIFRYVIFESNVDFKGTVFSGNIAFENLHFLKDADFTGASFRSDKDDRNPKLTLSYLSYKKLLISWDQLPPLEDWVTDTIERFKSFSDYEKEKKEASQRKPIKSLASDQPDKPDNKKTKEQFELLSQVLRSLEVNFRSLNKLDEANLAYYNRMKAELDEAKSSTNASHLLQKKLGWILLGIPSGYGTKISWITGWALLLVVLFAFLYMIKGELKRQPYPPSTKEFNFKQRLFDFPKDYCDHFDGPPIMSGAERSRFINALRFSFLLLLKVGIRDTTLTGKVWGFDYKYIVWFEWALGYFILGHLVVTLSNTLPILNRLITGVF